MESHGLPVAFHRMALSGEPRRPPPACVLHALRGQAHQVASRADLLALARRPARHRLSQVKHTLDVPLYIEVVIEVCLRQAQLVAGQQHGA